MWFRPLFLCISAVQALDLVNYGAFTVTATYSIANQLGFFTAYDLDVVFNQVPNSTFAYAQILNGDYDVLTGTIDNSVNLRLNSNESITVVGQLDQGPDLVLASVPNITSVDQLKGKSLIVDSPTSGYAYLLRKLLSENGLSEGTDYIFQVEPPMVYDNIV
jgi:ABC-type nitrate/sulfonate/bicarbonate transport system substrate-binding protein